MNFSSGECWDCKFLNSVFFFLISFNAFNRPNPVSEKLLEIYRKAPAMANSFSLLNKRINLAGVLHPFSKNLLNLF